MCHCTQFHITIALLFVAVFFEFSHAAQPQCESLSKVSPELGKICGYNFTARFRHDKHLDSAIRAVKSMTSILGNCSDFMNTMICSLFVPRCSEDIRGPYLPCREVCYEYASKCQGVIREKGLQWTVAMCDILAEKDNSETTEGYRGRCFKPQKFREGGHEYKHPCAKVVISACQGIPGFTHTVVSEDLQRQYGQFIEKSIGNISADPRCGEMRKQIVCAENMPACLNGTAGFLCRKRCESFFEQCKSPFFYGRDMCMEFPDKNEFTVDSPICKQTHWPRYENWPSPEPTSISTTLAATITGNGPTTKEPPKTDNTKQPGKPREQKSQESSRTKILAGTLVAVFLILIIVFGILVFLFFKRKRSRQFGYQKQVFYSDHRAEDDFIIDT